LLLIHEHDASIDGSIGYLSMNIVITSTSTVGTVQWSMRSEVHGYPMINDDRIDRE